MKKIIMVYLGFMGILNGCFEKRTNIEILKKVKGLEEDQKLKIAIKEGNVKNVIEALISGANPNAEVGDRKMVHLAAEKGDLAIIKELVNRGAEIKSINKAGETVLHIASRFGYVELIEYILTFFDKKDIEIMREDGRTALKLACCFGHSEAAIDLLIKRGADKELANEYGITALMEASLFGQLKVVELLIRDGADKEAVDKNGWTALMLASRGGQASVVETLVSLGANMEASTKYGEKSLTLACSGGYTDVIEILIKRGADKKAKDKNGWTVLMEASFFDKADVIEVLIRNGIEKEAVDKIGRTALMIACQRGHVKVLKELIRLGANKEAADKYGKTALMLASEEGRLDIIEELIKAGVNKEKVDKYGKTALMLAIEKRHVNVIKLLYGSLAKINVKDIFGKTSIGLLCHLAIKKEEYRPLFISIINHELTILRRLLQKRIGNITTKVISELKKLDKALKEGESLKTLIMVMECDDLIREEIFKKVVETSWLYSYIIENPQLKIDNTIFEIKYEKNKIERSTAEDIINLYIGRDVDDCKEQVFDEKIPKFKEPDQGNWCIVA